MRHQLAQLEKQYIAPRTAAWLVLFFIALAVMLTLAAVTGNVQLFEAAAAFVL